MIHERRPVVPPPVPGASDAWWLQAGVWLLLVTPLLLFWRPGRPFFFVHDDWTLLAQMSQTPFREYLAHSRNEHWFPLFKALFYGLAKVSGERYHLFVLVNCLLSGVNAVLVHHFFRLHLSAGSALALAFLYAVSGGHPGTVWTAAYLQFILALTFFWGALLTAAAYVRRPAAA
ncbi:MAG: hypothetical protein FJ128_14185, partial [Deltaproteobacteria bacterium]|nr:hypothetical protein [Deltaproteobacteria bacterium]